VQAIFVAVLKGAPIPYKVRFHEHFAPDGARACTIAIRTRRRATLVHA